MGNSLLAVRGINHKYIVVERNTDVFKTSKLKNMDSFLQEEDIWALSITITGRCNCYCSYCHYYAYRDRQKYNFDMPEELF